MDMLNLLGCGRNKNIPPPTPQNKGVDECIMEAKTLMRELHDLKKEVYNTLSAKDNDYFIRAISRYEDELKYR